MKKILSVLAISTLVFGSATAKKSVNLNYRNGAALFSFINNGESDDKKFSTTQQQDLNLFNLNAYNGGSDTLTFKASGDVLSFAVNIAPSIKKWSANSLKELSIGANFGAFSVLAGLNADGVAVGSFRVKKDVDASSHEGALFERFKPGSTFKGSYAAYSINQVNIGGGGATGIADRATGLGLSDREFFLQAGFNFAIPNSDAAFKLLGTVISDRSWNTSSDDDSYLSNDTNSQHNEGHLAYTVFAIFSKPSVFNAQAFIKMSPHCLGCDRDQVFVPGAYVEVTAIKNLDIMGGFTMSIVEGVYEDYAFDLRARYAVNSALSITYFGNLSVINGNAAKNASREISSEIGTYGKSYTHTEALLDGMKGLSSQAFLWNHINVRFALTDSIVPQLGIGAITDLVNGINIGPQKGEGTELSITPAVQFFASKNAFINVGFNVTFRGIGKEEHPCTDSNDETATQQGLDVALSLPVLFRVKL